MWRGLFSELYGIGNNIIIIIITIIIIIIIINCCLSNQIPFDLSVTFKTWTIMTANLLGYH